MTTPSHAANGLNTLSPRSSSTKEEIDNIIKTLDLEPHPEGGYFKEVFRDATIVNSNRSASTNIYYLLAEDECSLLHRIDASEGWHHYAGGSLQVVELDAAGPVVTRLGTNLSAGERPYYNVKAGQWFGAKPAQGAKWCLVGCTVAPAFAFEKFEFGQRKTLLKEFPKCSAWIEKLAHES